MNNNETNNFVKYENYKEQNERLKKALNNHFYLEAVFIEYSILEDRLDSILRYENNSFKDDNFVSIDRKIKRVIKISEEKKSLANKYFKPEFMESVKEWKEKRNPLIHALMKRSNSTEEICAVAEEGYILQKELCRLSQNYKRAVERKNKLNSI